MLHSITEYPKDIVQQVSDGYINLPSLVFLVFFFFKCSRMPMLPMNENQAFENGTLVKVFIFEQLGVMNFIKEHTKIYHDCKVTNVG